MNQKSRIIYLVEKCLSDLITQDEREELNTYLDANEYRDLVEDVVEQSFYSDIKLQDVSSDTSEAIFQSIIQATPVVKDINKKKVSYKKWATIAALFICIVSPLMVLMPSQSLQDVIQRIEKISGITEINNEIKNSEKVLPAEDLALLMTADGKILRLDELIVGESLNIGDIEIEKTGLANISFHYQSKQNSNSPKVNTLITPRGSRYTVTLSDGSVVELNAESKLIFPTYFANHERKVYLEGEAFFDIKHDSYRRFIVHVSTPSQQQEVFVYGTKFNINAYASSDGITTTLVEGSVKVKSSVLEQELKPMQQTLFKEGKLILSPANLDMNLAWKNELFYFEDEPIESVMHEIGRWYDVDIIYNGNTPTVKIWGQISREKGLSEILEILSKTNDLKFKVSGKEVYVME